jgi:16S rRNA (adenine1518-N6/adenine1519-N6)-dimethyltransferase
MRPPAALPGVRKRFGQHFLHDPAVIRRIIAAVAPRPGERMVEIGPGRGALTRPLLEQLGQLDVIEIDRDLGAALAREFAGTGLRIHLQDALKTDWRGLAGPDGRLRVVGNLPYNISTPLLFSLLAARDSILDLTAMLQREVAERITAPPGTGRYGRLSVMVQYHCAVEPLFTIGPGAFAPPPKVESAVIRLVPRPPTVPVRDYAFFDALVNQAFTQRRKTLRNAIAVLATPEQIRAAGIDAALRPEALSVEDFAALANAVAGT